MDLIQWLLSRGAKIRKQGQEYCINCPRCGDVKNHLYVNPSMGTFHCFKCGFKGRIEELLLSEGFTAQEIREMLGDRFVLIRKPGRKEQKIKVEFPEDSIELLACGTGVSMLLHAWCKDNGVRFVDLGWMKCRWWNGRLVIPCWKDRERKELLYWIARAIFDIEPKYLNCAASRTGVVWGLDWYDVSDGVLYVCEGWKDAYRMKGIALLGKQMDVGQEKRIVSLAKKHNVVIRVVLDADAWLDSIVIARRLRKHWDKVQVGFLVGLKDPGEGCSKEDVERRLAVSGVDNVFSLLNLLQGLREGVLAELWKV